jgi:hypothetical protein
MHQRFQHHIEFDRATTGPATPDVGLQRLDSVARYAPAVQVPSQYNQQGRY